MNKPNHLALAALERATKRLKKQLGKAEPLDPGTAGVALEVKIAGDVVVGQPVPPGEPVEVVDATSEDILAAIAATQPANKFEQLVRAAFAKLKARKGGKKAEREETLAELGIGKSRAEAVVEAEARRHRVLKDKRFPGRAGAVTGEPETTITGTVADRPITLELE